MSAERFIDTGPTAQRKAGSSLAKVATIACGVCPMQQFCQKLGGTETPVCEESGSPEYSDSSDSAYYTKALEDPTVPIVTARTPELKPVARTIEKPSVKAAPRRKPVAKASPVQPAPLGETLLASPSNKTPEKRNHSRAGLGVLVAAFVCDLLQLCPDDRS